MDIILVDTSGLTAGGADFGLDGLDGLGAAIAASVANVTEELEAEGLIPKSDAEPTEEGQDEDGQSEEMDAFEASLAASVAGSIASLGLDTEEENALESEDTAEEGDAPPLYSPKGKEHLYRIFDWLLHHGQPFRIIGCLPEVGPGMRDWFSEMLFEIRMKYEAATLMVVEIDHCTEETIDRLFDLGFRSIIVYDDGLLPLDEVEERLRSMERFHKRLYTDSEGGHRAPKQSELVCWGLWMDSGKAPSNYRRLRSYQDSIIPWDEITGPQFQMGREGEAEPTQPEAPGGYLPTALPCRLFDNAVTIDTTGAVLHCPRFCHSPSGVSANLFQHAPEEIFVHKGAASLRIGCASHCLDCGVGGRYFWPEDGVNVIKEFVALGRTEEGVGAYVPLAVDPGKASDFDLAAADPETQERELAEFEESLSDWAASMEQWQDDETST